MRKAFSLIELAVVITIIGLLTATIQAGIGVVKSAQTRALVGQLKEYKSSYYGFFSAYSGFPGDLGNASYLWSSAVNGDGDGLVEYVSGDSTEEFANTWTHLALGDFISSDYPALSYPEARDDIMKYIIIYYSDIHSQSGNSITIQANDFSGVMTPLEAYQLDCKIDDCSPTIGTTSIDNGDGITGSTTTCLNVSGELNSKDVHTDECRVIMWLD
ncbi:MAG: type II secretion system protein [Rickettsiales bacterium]|jgi:prepilin-type N-terminal cleavage/methylation domain-containing protein|nr:type II secretion system protein [Rickettsiales bacterium]